MKALTKWVTFCWSFRCIFLKENKCILRQISLKFVHKGPTDTKSVLVRVVVSNKQKTITWTNAVAQSRVYAVRVPMC